MVNIANGMQNRFFQKSAAVLAMDFFYIGRVTESNPAGPLHEHVKIRTGFFGGHVDLGSVPLSKSHTIHVDGFPEGIMIIEPYIDGSPGWRFFHDKPLMKLGDLRHRLERMEIKLADMVEESETIRSPEQLKELINEAHDMIQSTAQNAGAEVPVASPIRPANGGQRPENDEGY